MHTLPARQLALRKTVFLASARQAGQAVAQLQQGLVEVEEAGRVGALRLQVVGGCIRRKRAEGRAGGEARATRLSRPAVGAAQGQVTFQPGHTGLADFFAVVDERRARLQQVTGGGQLVGTQVATQLVPQPAAGKDVVVAQEGGHRGRGTLRPGAVMRGHPLHRLDFALGRADVVLHKAEREGATTHRRVAIGRGFGRGFAHHIAMLIALDQVLKLLGQRAAFRLVVPAHCVAFQQVRHSVEPVTIQPAVEPEAQAVLVVLQHRRVAEIEVGHVRPEGAEVEVAGARRRGRHLLDVAGVGPGFSLGCVPGVLAPDVPALRHLLGPHEPRAERVGRARQRLPEHRVRGSAVVDDVVHHHADSALVGFVDEFVEIGQRAVLGCNGAIVGGGVTVVAVGIRGDGHEPDAAHTQVSQMVQRHRQAAQVADAVAVAVAPGAHEDFHEGAVLPAFGQGAAGRASRHRAGVDVWSRCTGRIDQQGQRQRTHEG